MSSLLFVICDFCHFRVNFEEYFHAIFEMRRELLVVVERVLCFFVEAFQLCHRKDAYLGKCLWSLGVEV